MKEQELSELATEAAKKQARSVFEKRAQKGYETTITLREDELTALLARAFDAGQKAEKR